MTNPYCNGRLIKLLSNTVSQYDGLDISQNIINKFIEKNSWYKGNLFNQDMKDININTIYDLMVLRNSMDLEKISSK